MNPTDCTGRAIPCTACPIAGTCLNLLYSKTVYEDLLSVFKFLLPDFIIRPDLRTLLPLLLPDAILLVFESVPVFLTSIAVVLIQQPATSTSGLFELWLLVCTAQDLRVKAYFFIFFFRNFGLKGKKKLKTE